MAKINELPVELLVAIFLFLGLSPQEMMCWSGIARVCRAWYTIAVNSAPLWSNAKIRLGENVGYQATERRLHAAELCFQRSGTVKVSLSVIVIRMDIDRPDFQKYASQVVEMIRAHASDIGTLIYEHSSGRATLFPFSCPSAVLDTVRVILNYVNMWGEEVLLDHIFSNPVIVRHLECDGRFLEPLHNVSPLHLRSFKVCTWWDSPWERHFNFWDDISSFSAIEALDVEGLGDIPHVPNLPLNFPHLTTLVVINDSIRVLFPYLFSSLSNLAHLTLKRTWNQDSSWRPEGAQQSWPIMHRLRTLTTANLPAANVIQTMFTSPNLVALHFEGSSESRELLHALTQKASELNEGGEIFPLKLIRLWGTNSSATNEKKEKLQDIIRPSVDLLKLWPTGRLVVTRGEFAAHWIRRCFISEITGLHIERVRDMEYFCSEKLRARLALGRIKICEDRLRELEATDRLDTEWWKYGADSPMPLSDMF
ncbi:hypothetical protein DL93DRAFT_2087873 [Clavulina sp. PMI_390]|nr:hypothetical protein DL93DRAFT_2087873 [Clavulina sp. PMI_390]